VVRRLGGYAAFDSSPPAIMFVAEPAKMIVAPHGLDDQDRKTPSPREAPSPAAGGQLDARLLAGHRATALLISFKPASGVSAAAQARSQKAKPRNAAKAGGTRVYKSDCVTKQKVL